MLLRPIATRVSIRLIFSLRQGLGDLLAHVNRGLLGPACPALAGLARTHGDGKRLVIVTWSPCEVATANRASVSLHSKARSRGIEFSCQTGF